MKIIVEKRGDQVCIVRVTPLEPPAGQTQVIKVPETTITFPGTTFMFSTVLDEQTLVTKVIATEKGYTTTTTGIDFEDYAFETVVSMPGLTTTYSVPLPVYAEMIKECSDVVVTVENTFIIENVPATVIFAAGFPGTTIFIQGTEFTITLPPIETTTLFPPTTKTTTIKGTTNKYTTTEQGTTYTTMFVEPTTITSIFTEQEKIITSTIIITTTVEEGAEETKPTTTTVFEKKATETLRTEPYPPTDIITIATVSIIAIMIAAITVGILLRRC
ncbi:MAG: hypothetical protein NXY59_02920 [Aigarchaeota archaeon]|nr:hypothetical protein [Candidatus Pelearchaeum maunauluense]